MKRSALPVILLLLVFGAVVLLQQWQREPTANFAAPDFVLPDLDGRLHQFANLRDKVVFLNLWATWCPPCRLEMPSMERLHRRLQGRPFVLLAVNEDGDDGNAVLPFVKSLGLTFPILLDQQGRLPPRFGVTGYPETFIIDRTGNVVKHIIGPADWDSEDMVAYLVSLLDQAPNSRDGSASESR
jgi:thiol-disulfide isomerase/thioredoxin